MWNSSLEDHMKWQDAMSDTHVKAPHEGHVSPSGNVSPDEEEEGKFKLKWRPCPSCKSEGEGFRLICISYGQKQCNCCLRDLRESALRAAFTMRSGSVEREADKLLRKGGAKLQWKRGGLQIKFRSEE